MNCKFLLLIFSTFLIFGCDDEQAAGSGDADTYIKFFGASNADVAYVARQTPDGGCILLGTTEIDNEGTPVFKIKVIKVDNNGNTEWQKVYPEFEEILDGEAFPSDFEFSLTGRSIILADDGYIIVGDSIKSDRSTPSSLFVMKIDNSATDNTLDILSLNSSDIPRNTSFPAEYDIHGQDIIQDSEGNFRVISKIMNGDELLGTLFTQINADLTFNSTQNCFYDIVGKLDIVQSLHEAPDGDFVFGGTIKNDAIDNAVLRKIPACEQSISGASANIIINPPDDYTASQVIATNTGYAMIGTHVSSTGDTDVFFALLNGDGAVRPNYPMIYSDPDTDPRPGQNELFSGIGDDNEEGLTIANTADGGFIIGGSTRSETAGEEDILLVKTDVLGNIQWTKTIGNSNQEQATHIQQAADGGYLIFGNTEFGGIDTMVLIKTDKNGDIN